MIDNKYIIKASILILCVGSLSFSQSKTNSSDVIASPAPAVVDVSQTPDSPPPPQAWSFTFGGDENYLGVMTEPVTSENQNTYGVREARGVGISKVLKDSPAEKAGLQKNDVILRFDNEPVSSVRKLNRLIDESGPDHTAQLTIRRNGAEQQISVKLGKRSDSNARLLKNQPFKWDNDKIRPFGQDGMLQMDPNNLPQMFRVFGSARRIGVSTSPLTKQLAEYFGVKQGGVLVSSVNDGSPAAKAGLKAGDVVTEVDGNKVNSSMDLIQEIGKKKDGDVTLTIIRDKSQRTIKVTPEAIANPDDLRNFDWPQVGELVAPNLKQLSIPEIKTLVAPHVIVVPRITIPKMRILTAPEPPAQIL
ncbi:MAG: serine protease Do [Blastocatellia bacterium]|nr:serine protease Do [Blastocatellia bacterium]